MNLVLAQAAPSAGAGELWAFVLIGALALGSALAMVLMRNAVHAALMLVVNFFAIAMIYAVLEAQFLAVVQIIVYAGAIVVLFLFVLMLMGVGGKERFTERIRGQKTAAVLLGLAVFVLIGGAVASPYLGDAAACNAPAEVRAQGDGGVCLGLTSANADGNVRGLGLLLFTDYVWPFEVMSVLLVIAALGAMVLGKRREDPADLVDQGAPGVPATTGGATREAAAGETARPGDASSPSRTGGARRADDDEGGA
jgi:NADH-quinone oxidoreductase subunit J